MPQANPATPAPFPAPYGGINLRDGVSSLQPFEAREMVNWEPQGSSLKPRPGENVHSDDVGGVGTPGAIGVQTLAVWSSPSASKLLGVAGKVYDFSSLTATVVAGSPTYVSSRWQTENYNSWLIAVNGQDTPWRFGVTTVGAPPVLIDGAGFYGSGLGPQNLANVRMVHTRLWFCEKGSADAWYGDILAITGLLTKFQLSQVVSDGYLVAIGAHSQEAGQGADDLTCFIMSSGKVVVYSGDPGQTFSKIGEYNLGALPIGRDCIHQLGGALHIVTTLGVIPLTIAMQTSSMDFQAMQNYGKAGPGMKVDADKYRALAGWCLRTWLGRLILNVPTADKLNSHQWVLLTQAGAWTTWEGFDAASMVEWDGVLYYGDPARTRVHQVGGFNDEGSPIKMRVRTACVTFFQGMQSQATAVRFDMAVAGTFSGRFGVDDDYFTRVIRGPEQIIARSMPGTPFGSRWGSPWGASQVAKPLWFGTYGQGAALGIAMEATALASSVEWFGSQLLTQQLGPGV